MTTPKSQLYTAWRKVARIFFFFVAKDSILGSKQGDYFFLKERKKMQKLLEAFLEDGFRTVLEVKFIEEKKM